MSRVIRISSCTYVHACRTLELAKRLTSLILKTFSRWTYILLGNISSAAALGVIAALVAKCRVEVEREFDDKTVTTEKEYR